LVDVPPSLIRNNAEILRRVESVREFRLASKKEKTRESAQTPSLFGEIRTVKGNYLAVPEASSERRPITPIGFLRSSIVPSNKIQVVSNATLFHFGILCSVMHMAWMRTLLSARLNPDQPGFVLLAFRSEQRIHPLRFDAIEQHPFRENLFADAALVVTPTINNRTAGRTTLRTWPHADPAQ
jgi:hypothetical protein